MDRPLCETCEKNLAVKMKNGRFKKKCDSCSRKKETIEARSRRRKPGNKRKAWFKHKKDYCEYPGCTTTIVHRCQLDVDHIDGNKNNNDPSNYMTLCASCHRLKTFLNRDWDKKAIKSAVALGHMPEPKVLTS